MEFVDDRVRLDYHVGLSEPRSHSVKDDAVQAHEDSQWNEDIQDIQVDHARKIWKRVAVIETKDVYSLEKSSANFQFLRDKATFHNHLYYIC